MPYIDRKLRPPIDAAIGTLNVEQMTAGEINYAITRIIHEWLGSDPRYANYNAAVGVLECAKLEFHRTRVAHYEDAAQAKNGPL